MFGLRFCPTPMSAFHPKLTLVLKRFWLGKFVGVLVAIVRKLPSADPCESAQTIMSFVMMGSGVRVT